MAAVSQSSDTVSSSIKEALAANKSAILGEIADLDEHLAGIEKMIEEHKAAAGAIHELVKSIEADVKTLLTNVEANQKAINEVKMILEDAKGVHEELSSSKRALVFLTTVAAGVGLFAINAIGGRSSE